MSGKQRRDSRTLAGQAGMSHTAAAQEVAQRAILPCLDPAHPRLDDGGIPTMLTCEKKARAIGQGSSWLASIQADHHRAQQVPHTIAQAQPAAASGIARMEEEVS